MAFKALSLSPSDVYFEIRRVHQTLLSEYLKIFCDLGVCFITLHFDGGSLLGCYIMVSGK